MFFAQPSVSRKSVKRKKTQMKKVCREDKETHSYRVNLYCKICDRKVEVIIRDRPCGRVIGDTHELKNVGCRICNDTKSTIRMFFKCMPGGHDYENYYFANVRVTNIDPFTTVD